MSHWAINAIEFVLFITMTLSALNSKASTANTFVGGGTNFTSTKYAKVMKKVTYLCLFVFQPLLVRPIFCISTFRLFVVNSVILQVCPWKSGAGVPCVRWQLRRTCVMGCEHCLRFSYGSKRAFKRDLTMEYFISRGLLKCWFFYESSINILTLSHNMKPEPYRLQMAANGGIAPHDDAINYLHSGYGGGNCATGMGGGVFDGDGRKHWKRMECQLLLCHDSVASRDGTCRLLSLPTGSVVLKIDTLITSLHATTLRSVFVTDECIVSFIGLKFHGPQCCFFFSFFAPQIGITLSPIKYEVVVLLVHCFLIAQYLASKDGRLRCHSLIDDGEEVMLALKLSNSRR